ncbi:hypothetical protein ACP70R_034372 [Stipagrostis hirtigluma subsp. patula]
MGHQGSQKRQHKSVASTDIISNLPEVIKDKILCCLPIEEAVGTCLLSRKWRYTWASMTELSFSSDDFASINKFVYFTNMFLSLHNGPVLKFELNTQWGQMLSDRGDTHRWILMLSRNGVKEIQIRTRIWEDYKIPSSFFSCDQLEYVYLQECAFQLPPLFKGFKLLHTLHLEGFRASGDDIGDLVASCPNLEKLTLSRSLRLIDINIKSIKLRTLSIDGVFNHLNLHAPHVTLAFIKLPVCIGDEPRAGCNNNISQFIGSLSDIENITLLGQVFEYAAHGILPGKMPPSFNRLTEITLGIDLGNLKEAQAAHCLFRSAPNLRRIDLQLTYRGYSTTPTSCFWDSMDPEVRLFNKLDVVCMTNFAGTYAELRFLKHLLEGAPILRKVQIEENGKLDRVTLKHLLKMRRVSKDAEVIVL